MSKHPFHYRELIVTGTIDRAILHLGAPAAFAALMQAGFLLVDTFWLGRLGPVALAGASTAGFLMWVAQALGEGAASGSGAILARAIGATDLPAARRAMAAGLVLALASGVTLSVIGWVAAPFSFRFMGTAENVTSEGLAYIRVILVGMPAYFLFVWVAAALRASGDARTPVWLLALAASANFLACPMLIFGAGPIAGQGIRGAGLATAGSWLAAAVIGSAHLARRGLLPGPSALLRPPREVELAMAVGLPLGAEGALFSLIYILLARIVTGFGTTAVAALGVGHKLEVFNYFVCAGMASAANTMVGQNLGAGEPARASRAAWRCLFLTVVPVGLVTIGLVSAPRASIGVFSPDGGVMNVGALYVLLVGLSQPFMAFDVVLLGAFAGAHRTMLPATLETLLTACRIPLAWYLVSKGWGVEAVWIAISATTVAKGGVLAALFASWQRRSAPGSQGLAAATA